MSAPIDLNTDIPHGSLVKTKLGQRGRVSKVVKRGHRAKKPNTPFVLVSLISNNRTLDVYGGELIRSGPA